MTTLRYFFDLMAQYYIGFHFAYSAVTKGTLAWLTGTIKVKKACLFNMVRGLTGGGKSGTLYQWKRFCF